MNRGNHTQPDSGILSRRELGSTGEGIPVFGLGTGPAGMGLADRDAISLYEQAVDMGVTYFDTAPGYGRAQLQLRHLLRSRRGVNRASKSPARRAGPVRGVYGP